MEDEEPVRMEIRRARGDAELQECARLMAESEPWLTLGRGYDAGLRLLNDPAKEVHVAVGAEGVLGFVVLDMRGAFVGYLQTIAVKARFRGRAVGRALIRFAEDRIFSESPNVFLCVSSFNERARALYLRLGYRVVGELPDFVVPGHSELLLRKTKGPLRP